MWLRRPLRRNDLNPGLIPVEVIDTGLACGIHNAAVDSACLKPQDKWRSSGMLRFYRSRPTASIGRHQALDRELRLDYCHTHDIKIVRRPTSGGALYLDPSQLGFSLILRRPGKWRKLALAQLLELGSAAVVTALEQLGIAAVFKFPNDIEVGGRKIASVFSTFEGNAFLLHGSVLLDADIATMLKVLRVPTEKLSPHGLAAARERLTSVNALCGDWLPLPDIKTALMNGIATQFGLKLRAGDGTPHPEPTPEELAAVQSLAQVIRWDGGKNRKTEALIRSSGGTLRARAEFTPTDTCLRGVEFASDVQIEPACFFTELERALEALPISLISERIAAFRQRYTVDAVGFSINDAEQLLLQLADKHQFAQRSGLDAAAINALMPFSPAAESDCASLLSKASVMLVPYCAKPVWCEWRQRDGCTECGLCEVGTAYAIARDRNMQITTVTNYEHLVATLAKLKTRQTEAYVGMCCSNFFIKRYRAFAEAGVPALLMDISGANCYELRQEEQAYAGTFAAEAKLDEGLLTHIMSFVPRQPVAGLSNGES